MTTTLDRSNALFAMLRKRYSLNVGNGPRYVTAMEVRNAAGFRATRSCDFIAMDTWDSGPVRLIGHEVKASRSDWLRELAVPAKSGAFIQHVAEWWLVVHDRKIVRDGELPEGWGLLAPAGDALRVIVSPSRKPQPTIPATFLAPLLRAIASGHRSDLQQERRRPFAASDCPRAPIMDAVGPGLVRRHGEFQSPRYDLRRLP